MKILLFLRGKNVKDFKEIVKKIIDRLTENTASTFTEQVLHLAGESGIGESHVNEAIKDLINENYLDEPLRGVLKKVS